MRTIGQTLKEARENRGFSLEEVEKNTKIRKELLGYLEKNDFDKLPPAIFIQGFIKNYGRFLGLSPEKLQALFRRDYEASKHPPVVLESLANPLKNQKIRLTPAKIFGVVVVLVIMCFFAYLWVEYRQFVGAPPLNITSPQDQQTVDVPSVVIKGDTDPDAQVLVNNQTVGVDANGHFEEEIKLTSSTNEIDVVSTSKFGQSAKIQRTVFVKK